MLAFPLIAPSSLLLSRQFTLIIMSLKQVNYPKQVVPPPPLSFMEAFNSLLHTEPISTMANATVWSVMLGLGAPIGVAYLQLRSVWKFWQRYVLGWKIRNMPRLCNGSSREVKQLMAVVITGCDTGFGRMLAERAAAQGFVVFAGCLTLQAVAEMTKMSKGEKYGHRLKPVVMDVTRDEHVEAVVSAVEKWLKEDPSGTPRVFHALVNNAGIATLGHFDWTPIEEYEKLVESKFSFSLLICAL